MWTANTQRLVKLVIHITKKFLLFSSGLYCITLDWWAAKQRHVVVSKQTVALTPELRVILANYSNQISSDLLFTALVPRRTKLSHDWCTKINSCSRYLRTALVMGTICRHQAQRFPWTSGNLTCWPCFPVDWLKNVRAAYDIHVWYFSKYVPFQGR